MAFHGGAGGGGGSEYDPWGRPIATQRSGVPPEGRAYGATDEDTYDQGVPTLERFPMVASNDPSTLPNAYASQPHVSQPQPPPAWPATPAAPVGPSAYRPQPSRPAGAVPTMVSGDPAEQTPWAAPPAFSAAPPRKGVSATVVVIGAVLIAGSSFAAGWLLRPERPPEAHVVPPAKVVVATAAPSEAPAVSATAAPPASSGEQPADGDADGDVDIDNALPADESDADLSKLLADQGYLIVRSSGDAEVVVNGIVIGHTNRLLVSRCYTKHVRLREGSSQRWLTEGQAVYIACSGSTTVQIDP